MHGQGVRDKKRFREELAGTSARRSEEQNGEGESSERVALEVVAIVCVSVREMNLEAADLSMERERRLHRSVPTLVPGRIASCLPPLHCRLYVHVGECLLPNCVEAAHTGSSSTPLGNMLIFFCTRRTFAQQSSSAPQKLFLLPSCFSHCYVENTT